MKLAVILAVLVLLSLCVLTASARGDGTPTPPPDLTPVLPPPVACGIPGWPPCWIYEHHVFAPCVEVRR